MTVNVFRISAQCSEFFGLLSHGGEKSIGAIFKTDGNGDNFQIVYSFQDKTGGSYPEGKLCPGPGGKYYGTTRSGGKFDGGVIFEWDQASNEITKKADFNRIENGSNPKGSMIPEDNGKFIGLTSQGGINDNGIIYEWDPMTNVIIKKFEFNDTIYQHTSSHNLIQANNGKFYGYKDLGVIELFEWDPTSNIYTKKGHFDIHPGFGQPCGSLIQADNGKLYGITTGVGDSSNFIFEFNPVNNKFSKKVNVNISPNHFPYSNLVQAENGKFYCLLSDWQYGVVIEWDTTSNTLMEKFSSPDLGSYPTSVFDLMKAGNGKIYGYFGKFYNGDDGNIFVIYEWDPAANILRTKRLLNKFGVVPTGSLTENIYAASCTMDINACNSFTSPSGKYLWTKTGVYRDTLQDSAGNDSIITVNLRISHPEASVEKWDFSLMATASDATYQWLDCNNNYKPIEGEIGTFFKPYRDGTYALKITKNGCTDTSACILCSCETNHGSIPCIDLSQGLVAYYPFNGNANDESGNEHHGTANGAVFVSDRFGNPNNACEMNGESNTLLFSCVELASPNLTISAWFKIQDELKDTLLILRNRLLSMLLRVANRKYQAEFVLGGQTVILTDEKGVFEIDPDHPRFDFMVLSYDGSQVTLRINNLIVDSKSLESSSLPFSFPVTLKNDIRYSLHGVVDDIRIYNRVINARETDALNNDRIISAPLLSTDSVTNTGRYSAVVFVTLDHNVIPYSNNEGLCWSTSPGSDITFCQLFKKEDPLNTGIHQYRIIVYGLVPNTNYYIRSFTTGSSGIKYGNELTFKTLPPFIFGSVADVEGNVYKTIPINNRNWMAENLKTTKYNEGSPIPNVKDMQWNSLTSGAYCWYDNDETNKIIYGALYNYNTVTDDRQVCPSGWHVPTPSEWASIPYSFDCEAFLEREVPHNCQGCNLREAGSGDWEYAKGTNETGFSALPGGRRQPRNYNGLGFDDIHKISYFWESNGNSFYLTSNAESPSLDSNLINYGFSIRCIEDQQVIISTPEQSIKRNTSFEIPVIAVDLPTGKALSYQFDLNCSDENIQYQGYSTEGTISSSGSIIVNSSLDRLSVAWGGQIPLADSGILVKLRFMALECGNITPVLSNFLVNSDTIKNIRNGIIVISIDSTDNQGLPTVLQGSSQKNIEIYPNPGNTILHFRNLRGETSVIIYDLQGRRIMAKKITNDEIDISGLPHGFYTIQISDNNQSLTRKLIRQ
jgi:uncharacterized protein (TIGR02145 family)